MFFETCRKAVPTYPQVLINVSLSFSFKKLHQTPNFLLARHTTAGAETECYRVLSGALADSTCVDGCCTAEGLLPNGTSTFCGFNEDIDSVIVSWGEGRGLLGA